MVYPFLLRPVITRSSLFDYLMFDYLMFCWREVEYSRTTVSVEKIGINVDYPFSTKMDCTTWIESTLTFGRLREEVK